MRSTVGYCVLAMAGADTSGATPALTMLPPKAPAKVTVEVIEEPFRWGVFLDGLCRYSGSREACEVRAKLLAERLNPPRSPRY